MKLDPDRFQQIIQIQDPNVREVELQEFCIENKLGINAQEIIAIAQMVCAIAAVICPIIEVM